MSISQHKDGKIKYSNSEMTTF